MSLRIKTLFSIGCILTILIIVISAIAVVVMMKSAKSLENIQVQTNVERVIEAIHVGADNLRSKMADWAVWDDAYAFVTDHNPRFIRSNLIADVYINLQINSILFFDTKGMLVFGNMIDLTTGVESSPSTSIIAGIQPIREKLLSDTTIKDITGIVQFPEGPMLVTVQPILKSDTSGPPAGVMVFIKYIDEPYAKYIAGITKTTLIIHPLNQPLAEQHDQVVLERLLSGGSTENVVLDDKTVAGYTVMKDIDGNNALLLDVTIPRLFYTQITQSLWYLLAHFVGAIVVALILILIIIEIFVMSPLFVIRREIGKMSTSGDLSKRLTELKNNDELAGLSKDLNKMLQSMEYTQRLLSSEKEKSQVYIDVIKYSIVVISTDETIMLLNKKGCELLEYTEAEVVGKNWFDMCIPEDSRENIRAVFGKIIKGEVKDFEQAENAVVTKSGKRRFIAWRNSVIKNNEGVIIATISSGEDVTERSSSEKKLQEREKQLALAQQMAGVGSWEWNVVNNHAESSDEVSTMLGIKHVPLGGIEDVFLKYAHPDDRTLIDAATDGALKDHTPINVEARFIRPDGDVRILSLRGQLILDDQNKLTKIIGIAQDLTEQKHSEEKMLARTRELESMNSTMVGREIRMAELKKQVDTLTTELETYKKNAQAVKPTI
jgi:PAS domain S-box-containing protein